MKRIMAVISVLSVIGIVNVDAGTISGSVSVNPNITHTATNSSIPQAPVERYNTSNGGYNQTLASNGTNQFGMNQFWSDQRTLLTGGSDSLDVYDSLVDYSGVTTRFKKIKWIMIKTATLNSNSLYVGNASAAVLIFAATNDAINLPPGSVFVWNGLDTPVTAANGVSDILRISNSVGYSATYDVEIGGSDN